MPRNTITYDLFIASPSDVEEERESLENIVRELNVAWNKRDIHLNLIKWESHIYPGKSSEDSQQVINQQLPEKVDIFIGILFSRIGTKTSKSDSGTIEEFEKALNQHEQDSESINIMFYFKRGAEINFDEFDFSQLEKVNEFRKTQQENGLLTRDYKNISEFEELVRTHLNTLLMDKTHSSDLIKQKSNTPEEVKELPAKEKSKQEKPIDEIKENSVKKDSSKDDPEEEGLLDLQESFYNSGELYVKSTNTITEHINNLTEKMDDSLISMDEIQKSKKNLTQSEIKHLKKLIDTLAFEIESTGNFITTELDDVDLSFTTLMRTLEKIIVITPDFGADFFSDDKELEASLITFKKSLDDNLETSISFLDQIEKLPRITTRFNKAKRTLYSSIKKQQDLYKVNREQIVTLINSIKKN